MTFGSLFAGIGGMDLGLERAGMECRWQVEIDPYCRKVLAKHWPDVPKYEDVRDVGNHNLESVDLIAGGFPCQDISNAGKRVGIDGERSGLWGEYARIIRDLRPTYVLVENVSALLARGLERVLGDLAEGGYDAEWDCIPAAAIGAPHQRDRLFVIAHPHGKPMGKQHNHEAPGRNADGPLPSLAHAHRPRLEGHGLASDACVLRTQETPSLFRGSRGAEQWGVEPDVGRVADGIPARVDRLKGLGNAVVPQVAEYIGRLIMEHSRQRQAA